MRDMVNILKYSLAQNKILKIVTITIYLIFVIGITSIGGLFLGTFINFGILMVGLVFAPVIGFFESTRKISRENALLFSTPINPTSYLVAKILEYVVDIFPIGIIFLIQCLIMNQRYAGVFGQLDILQVLFFSSALVFIGGFLIFVGSISLFIITKKYIKRYWLNVILTIGLSIAIEVLVVAFERILYKVIPFYYIEIYGGRIGILEIVIILVVVIVQFVLAKKVLEKGIDINQ